MKKVVLSLALVAMMSVSFVSCKETKEEAPVETEAPAEVEAPVEEPVAPVADTIATEEAPVEVAPAN